MLPYVSPMRSFLILAVVFSVGCGKLESITGPGGGGEPIDPSATFTRVQAEVFTPSCANIGCHDPLGQQSQLILTAGRSYDMIVNRSSVEMTNLLRVAPGDPANSYLYRKITGAGITGDRMPQGGPQLSDAKIQLVKDWIRRGAPND